MKLLFDQNLSQRLIGAFADDYRGSAHVGEVGLDTATDVEVWAYAGEHGFTIISKDSDFRQLAFMHGPPPKAIWVRVGNATTDEIATVISVHRDAITRFGDDHEEALLVIE